MFEDSLIESAGVLKTKRPAATAASLLLQCILVAVLAALPLLYTEALPLDSVVSLVLPGPPSGPAPARPDSKRHAASPRDSDMVGHKLREPQAIPKRIASIEEDEAPPPNLSSQGPGVYGSTGPGSGSNPLNTIVNLTPPPVVAAPSVSGPLRVSEGVAQGFLVHEVKPLYPPLARQARIQGSVMLQAIIGKDGRIENLRVISGHPMLAPAAIEAVKQWRYRPYTLNRQPVEVETQITVNFLLGGG